jgi:hypothetical protein
MIQIFIFYQFIYILKKKFEDLNYFNLKFMLSLKFFGFKFTSIIIFSFLIF